MTLLPHQNRDVRGLKGPMFPPYRVGPLCCSPTCSRWADHSHHLWRRSALGGPFDWVELWNHRIFQNVVPLCHRCHDEVTGGKIWIRWDEERELFVWDDNIMKYPPQIFPQPLAHAPALTLVEPERPELGPAAMVVCPGCHRPIPQETEKKQRDVSRRRKTWTVKVPDDSAEDGALVLDTLVEECRKMFMHDTAENVRYFTIVQALALVVQNGHLLAPASA